MADSNNDNGQSSRTDSSNSDGIDSGSNVFNNDGNFLERFRQLQKQEEEKQKLSSSSFPSVKLPPILGPGKKLLAKRRGFLPQKTKPTISASSSSDDNPPVIKKSKGLFSDQTILFNTPHSLLYKYSL